MRPLLKLVAAALALWVLSLLYSCTTDPTWAVMLFALVGLILAITGPQRHSALALVLTCLILYLGNGRVSVSGDTLATRYLPLSVLREGNFDLDEFPFMRARNTPYARSPGALPYFVREVNGHVVSAYTVHAAVLALPFYLPSVVGGVEPESPLVPLLEKLAAATIAATSVGVLYLALRRRVNETLALVLGLTCGLGTSTLSWSSQGLWQHGASQLALTVTLYCLVREGWVKFAGLPLAFAVFARPSDVVLAVPLLIYVAGQHRRQLAGFCLSTLPPVLFQAWYNQAYYGHLWLMPMGPTPLTISSQGLALPALTDSAPPVWGLTSLVLGTRLGEGLAGILLSPGRGLLVYSPVCLLSFAAILSSWRPGGDRLVRCLGVGVALELGLVGSLDGWWGGHSYGPRLLADLAPLLVFCLYPLEGWLKRSRAGRGLFAACLAWSVLAHAVGAYVPDSWNSDVDVDFYPACLWSWDNNQLVNPLRRLRDGAEVILRQMPTSRDDYGLLGATCQARSAASASVPLKAGSRLEVYFRATNSGRAVWLSGSGPGAVRLRWRWLRDGKVPVAQGGPGLGHHVFPGQAYGFRIGLPVPAQPGSYTLELGLVCEYVGSFADFGVPPVLLPLTVQL